MTAPSPFVAEMRVAKAVRVYERVKLGILVAVLLGNIFIGVYLIGLSHDNRSSLTILRCAVDKQVQVDKHGHVRTKAEQRAAFDFCVSHGGSFP